MLKSKSPLIHKNNFSALPDVLLNYLLGYLDLKIVFSIMLLISKDTKQAVLKHNLKLDKLYSVVKNSDQRNFLIYAAVRMQATDFLKSQIEHWDVEFIFSIYPPSPSL